MRRLLALIVLALGFAAPSLEAQARPHYTSGQNFGRAATAPVLRTRAAHMQALSRIQSRYRSRAGRSAQRGPRSGYVSFQPQVSGMGCLQPRTRAMIAHLTAKIGPIQITSTCGGRHASNSQHYRGNAIDFRPQRASVGAALAALRSMPEVGGIGSYSGGLIHADVGAREARWYGHRGSSKMAKRGGFRAQYAALKSKKRR